MRIRITFAKTDAMRFTSHLDLHRTWERTLRRANLPLAYSHGFNPHPKINLACALPLGFTSTQEIADVWLEKILTITEIYSALESAVPPGVLVTNIETVDDREPALQTIVKASEYRITFLKHQPDMAERVSSLLAQKNLPRRWRNKPYDLRPLILDLRVLLVDELGRERVLALLSAQEGATGRPEEVIMELGGTPENTLVHRERLVFEESVNAWAE